MCGPIGPLSELVVQWVETFVWNDATHTAKGIIEVTFIARDQVNVRMKDALTGCLSTVDSNIEAVRLELLDQVALTFIQQLLDGEFFTDGQGEIIRNMSFVNDE